MVEVPFICGVVFDDDSIVDIPAPSIGGGFYLSAVEGEHFGQENGCKGKLDYEGNLWFFAVGGLNSDKFLVKVHWVSGTTFTVTYKQIPTILAGEIEVIPEPNQLTVDIDGNVYFPSGLIAATGFTEFYVAKVTGTTDPDPDNWTVTWTTYSNGFDDAIGTYGVALNRDHTKILTHVWRHGTNGDWGAEINTDDMTLDAHFSLDLNDAGTYNIETDVSGGINEGYSYLINVDSGAAWIGVWEWGVGISEWHPCESDSERVVAVNTNGYIYTMERITHCPISGNPLRIYVPSVVGHIEYADVIEMQCVVLITPPPKGAGGSTTTMRPPTHHDILRSDNTTWPASGFNPTQGDVRRISYLSQQCKARTTVGITRYHYICTATGREPYDNPLPPLPPVWGILATFVVTPLPGRKVDVYFCSNISSPPGTPLLVDFGDGTINSDVINPGNCHHRNHTYTLAPGTSVTCRVTTPDGRLFVYNFSGDVTQDTITILA